jgi:excinuclease ABC subunit A
MTNYIEIKGARQHNLKNIDLKIPREKLVVITGPSGSGKSSLAFDTIYAEGQRRYVESLSAYARQFLEKMPKPEVDTINGIHPAIAIQQKAPSGNPRSTVGTVTEIYDYLRLLFARIGIIHCYKCQHLIKKDQPDDVLNIIGKMTDGKIFYISFPVPQDLMGNTQHLKEVIMSRGFVRVWQAGRLIDLREQVFNIQQEPAYVVVDRQKKTKTLDRFRLIDSIEQAFHEGEGALGLITEEGEITHFNQNFICSKCGTKMIEPQPRLFSFNNPFGACEGCQGFGDMMDLDLNKIVPDPGKTLQEGAIAPWNSPAYRHILTKLAHAAPNYGISMEIPFQNLSPDQQELIINGNRHFIGVRGFFKRLEKKKYKVHVRVLISRFRSYFTCTSCHGKRLRPEALAITIGDKDISELTKMKIGEIYQFFSHLPLSKRQIQIADQLLKEINNRLNYLMEVGLDYLNLDRRANTLSGGEFQRINLATALGTSLTGTLYILDEPTIGLHSRDTNRLIKILQSLADMGNTALIVEHDRLVIEHAQHVIDLGPAAGENGGEIIYAGGYKGLLINKKSLTSQYLRNEKEISIKSQYRRGNGNAITIINAFANNLKNLNVGIPLGMMVVVTGVSGSGKSTLVEDVLYQGYLSQRGEHKGKVGAHDEIRGLKNIYKIEMIDQSPIGRTPRSNPITYIKGFDEIRKLYAKTTRARATGFTPGHFSFNVTGGRCDTCEGAGQIRIEMQFMADVHLQCDSCKGKRFKPEVLNVYYKNKNIYDILELTVEQALDFFKDHQQIIRKIQVLQQVGLGYIKLGQSATTLSGGEAQRVKLAAHLSRQSHRNVLFIMDEPTTGLHFDDIHKLLQAINQLIERGASVLMIEHHLDIIQQADWIIDLGPEGGDAGGFIVAEGTPRDIIKNSESYTGKYLKMYLNKRKSV